MSTDFEAFVQTVPVDDVQWMPGARAVESKPLLAQRGAAKAGRLASDGIKKGTDTVATSGSLFDAVNRQWQGIAHNNLIRQVVRMDGSDGRPAMTFDTGTLIARYPHLAGMDGTRLVRAVEDAAKADPTIGDVLVPWNPNQAVGSGQISRFDVPDGATGPDVLWVRKPLFDALVSETKRYGGPAMKLVDKPTQWWKNAILPFSPSWQLGNTSGAYVMALVSEGIDPVTFHRELRKGWQQAKAAESGEPGALAEITPRFRNTGEHPTTSQARAALRPDRDPTVDMGAGRTGRDVNRQVFADQQGSRPRQFLRRQMQRSYDFNERMDTAAKLAVQSIIEANGGNHQLAVETAMRAMPNFELSGFERGVLRRIVPFYAWQKHLTLSAMRLPVEHPARVGWLAYMAQTWLTDEERTGGLPFMRGMLPVGGDKYLPLGGLMPYNAITALPGDPRNLAKFVNPVAQLGMAGVLGLDPRQQLKPLSYADESKWYTPYGQETPRPLLSHPSGALNYFANISPVSRLVNEQVRGGDMIRYDSGEAVTRRGRPLRSDSRPLLPGPLQGIARPVAGLLPVLTEMDVARQERERRERELARRKARR